MACSTSEFTISDLAKAVPLGECRYLPVSTPTLPEHQNGHIPIASDMIHDNLWEILQKPYVNGTGRDKDAKLRIAYFPSGFTVGKVLLKDLSEVSDPDGDVASIFDGFCPNKTSLHVDFCEPAYGEKVHMPQRRTPSTRGTFAKLAAEEIERVLARLPEFPYTVNQIRVLSIDVRSRGTMQPRIFVASDVMQTQVQ